MPGTATERDVIELHDRENRLFELVNGTLVEKVMGFDESIYALLLAASLIDHLKTHDVGKVVGSDGMLRLFPGMVRIPDAAFISWGRYPKGKRKRGEIPNVVPDLIVEVLSKGNTHKEMVRKLGEYFRAGAPAGLVHQSEAADRAGLYRPRSIDLARRGSNARWWRRPAGLLHIDPRLVRRSRAD